MPGFGAETNRGLDIDGPPKLIIKMAEKIAQLEMNLAAANDKIAVLEKENDELKDEMYWHAKQT